MHASRFYRNVTPSSDSSRVGSFAGVVRQEFPGAADVRFLRAHMADGHADGDAPAQARVGKKYLSRPIDRNRAAVRWLRRAPDPAGAGRPDSNGNRPPENGTGATRSKSACASTHAANCRANCKCRSRCSRMPRAPNDRSTIHSFSARKRRPSWMPVSIRFCASGLRRPQVVGRQRERRSHHIHAPAVERAQIERREQPLVRVDDQRVRALGAVEHVRVRRQHRRGAAVRRVDVQPHALRVRRSSAIAGTGSMLVVDVVPTVATTARARRRRRGPAAIAASSRSARIRNVVVDGDLAQRLLAEAERDDRLVDRRVRLLGAVDARRVRRRCGRPDPRALTPGTAACRAAASACSVAIDAVS